MSSNRCRLPLKVGVCRCLGSVNLFLGRWRVEVDCFRAKEPKPDPNHNKHDTPSNTTVQGLGIPQTVTLNPAELDGVVPKKPDTGNPKH